MEIFTLKDISFAYPEQKKRALSDISFTVSEGEFIVLCGKSGCGKTTLLRQLKTVLAPHGNLEGEVLYGNRHLREVDLREQASDIGYVLQHPDHQIVTDKVWHELAFGLENLGYPKEVIELRSAEMADFMGISAWYEKDVSKISGGQKQLLNLAAVMAMQPKMLILDEPTSQLDPLAAGEFIRTLKRINEEFGTTILLSAHRLDEVFSMADRVLVMEKGTILADDMPERIGDYLIGNEMEQAMPVPVRVYMSMSSTRDNVHIKDKDNNKCPTTIKEGQEYLSKICPDVRILREKPKINRELLPEKDVVLCAKDVWFRYEKEGKDILADLSLQLREGEVYALLGANGSGKTTMLSVISGLRRAYRGKISIYNKKLSAYKPEELFCGILGMLPQDPQTLFVEEAVAKEIPDEALLAEMELEHLKELHPYDLSGGEQQRTALAKVMQTSPKIILLDEPTKGMDAGYKKKFGRMLAEWSQKGKTILLVSHDVEFCAEHAHRCGLFFQGKIIAEKEAKEFFVGNSFYTTAANRMSRHLFENAVTVEEVIELCSQAHI